MSHAERMAALAEVHRAYEGDALVHDPARLFPAPSRSSPAARRAGAMAIRAVRPGVWEATWPSDFEPFLTEVAERYLSGVENRTARARFYVAGTAHGPEAETRRPALLAIHGYMTGQWVFEEKQWPVEWLVRRGLDVVLPVLPFHAGRAGSRRGAPGFPSSDPRVTNEGFRQAIADLRSIVRFLRERGAPHVGVIGMSLGGYTAALLATVTDEIDFVVPMIPLASIADFAREQGHLGEGDADTDNAHDAHSKVSEQHAALERANWVVSPLSRPLRLAKECALVIAAENDRITPVRHAERLAGHFGCEMMTIRGGHLLQLGRADAFRALGSLLERAKIIEPRSRSR